MARNVKACNVPFGYRRGNTVLHRFPAGLKLLVLFVLSAAAFGSIPGLLLAALLTAAASLAARIRPPELLRGSRPLMALALCILAFQTVRPSAPGIALGEITAFGLRLPPLVIPCISAEGFFAGLLSALRITISFAAGSLLFAVTSMRELWLSLGRAEQAIGGLFSRKRKAPPFRRYSRLSLGLSLMLGFIPRFFELWETANLACEARSCGRGLRRMKLVIPLVTERMMELAAGTAEALESRGI
jgi:energy-coupling factor transporter transmembrane protein EcfT